MAHPPSLGISPTPEVEGGWHPSLAYIRRGRGAFLIHDFLRQVLFSLVLLSPSLRGLPLFGVYTWLGISPPCACRCAAGIGIRIHLLSAARLVRSPEGRRVYCICIIPRGATLVALLHRCGRICENPLLGNVLGSKSFASC